MSQITTHILDTTTGKPAVSVPVILYAEETGGWTEMAAGFTNVDGRIADLLSKETQLANGLYKLKFMTKPYFSQSGITTFYPFVEIVFELSSTAHYHIPLLLSPFGYTTYRGS